MLSVCLLLLGGAWALSRALTGDVPIPTQHGVQTQPPEEPGVPAAPRALPVPQSPVVSSPPPEPEPPARPPPPPPPRPEEGPPPEKVEIDGIAAQGWAQLKDENGGPANWRRAEKLFVRCLTLSPDSQDCKDGLNRARQLAGPKRQNPRGVPLVPVQDPLVPDPEL